MNSVKHTTASAELQAIGSWVFPGKTVIVARYSQALTPGEINWVRVMSQARNQSTRPTAVRNSVLLLLVIAVLSMACGQKGDLILPDDAKAQQEKKKKSRLF